MLISLKAIDKPQTLAEALEKLRQPGVRPLYGGGLVRENSIETVETVDLSTCGLDKIELTGNTLSLGGAARLESIVSACSDLPGEVARSLIQILKQEAPITLRNALALGDVLNEAHPASPLRTWLIALGGRVRLAAHPLASGQLIEALLVQLDMNDEQALFGFAKVSRTPADAPIVCAVAWKEVEEERIAVGGLLLDPVLYHPGMPSQYEDWLGSADYRTAIAPVLVHRARRYEQIYR